MYCYFSEYKKNNLNLDIVSLQEKSISFDNIISLFTCNRVEFYSEEKISFLENNSWFTILENLEEIYNHFFKVVLWYNSEILFENAIIAQIDKILSNYKYKNNKLFNFLSGIFNDAIEYRLNYNLFSKNHWNFALDFILKNDFKRQNLIYIWSGAMVKDSIKFSFDKFENIVIVTRTKSKYLKGLTRKLTIISPESLVDLVWNINNFSVFIATTNIDDNYKKILENIFNNPKIQSAWNLCAFEIWVKIPKRLEYIDMYNENMKNYIDESNRENREKIDKNNFFNKIL